jgi:hypothetical protein
MMTVTNSSLLEQTRNWLERTPNVHSAVLFGSSASLLESGMTLSSSSSDLDLHLIVSNPSSIEQLDWESDFGEKSFVFQASRPASGGVRKLTAILSSGQIDLILVPYPMMCVAALGLQLGLYRKYKRLRCALNEMATCIHPSYRFLKGQKQWEPFYRQVSGLPGVRLCDEEIRCMADVSICDLLWVVQKVDAAELIAAQHVLHSRISDTNLRLWRELRRRTGCPSTPFGLGRRVESLGTESERNLLSISALLNAADLRSAAVKAFRSLQELMTQLQPSWRVPPFLHGRLTK